LRGHSSISAATRQRVHEAARQLSYSASPQASGLASGRTLTLGVVVPFVTRWFFVNVVAGAYEVLHAAGYDVLLYHLGTGEARDRFFERMPLSRRVDAVLTLTVPLTDEHTLALRALDMPLVTVGAALSGVSCVRIDDVGAMRTALHHLLHQGHEDILMITGVEDEAEFGFASSHHRRNSSTSRFVCAMTSSVDRSAKLCGPWYSLWKEIGPSKWIRRRYRRTLGHGVLPSAKRLERGRYPNRCVTGSSKMVYFMIGSVASLMRGPGSIRLMSLMPRPMSGGWIASRSGYPSAAHAGQRRTCRARRSSPAANAVSPSS